MEDSRLKGYTQRATHPTLPLERTYCVLCGKPKGWVTMETGNFIRVNNVITVCDQCEVDCAASGKTIPLVPAPIQEF